MRRIVGIIVATLLLGQTAAAQKEPAKAWDDEKPSWRWTPEERMAKRFDRTEMRKRAAAESARLARFRELGMPSVEPIERKSDQDGIDGMRNPELFLPHELFDHLLMDAFPPDGRHQQQTRRFVEERAAALGFGADLWKRLGRVASPYLELRRERDRLAFAEHQGKPAAERLDGTRAPEILCRTRAHALAAAKKEFDEAAFLRLLYEAVAPRLAIAYRLERNLENDLRYQAGGCQ